jgi:hypothetical protein
MSADFTAPFAKASLIAGLCESATFPKVVLTETILALQSAQNLSSTAFLFWQLKQSIRRDIIYQALKTGISLL